MELYDIIEELSGFLKNGTLVLHKSFNVHNKFKAYKKFCYDLYYIENNEKTIVLQFEETKNISSNDIEDTWKICDKLFLKVLIKWVLSNNYKALIDGVQ